MRPDIEQHLVEISPDFFSECGLSPEESAMVFGCECGDGWRAPLEELSARIALLNESMARPRGFRIVASQIKEKFGGLSVYWALKPLDDSGEVVKDADTFNLQGIVDAVIDKASDRAWHTCECCGAEETTDNRLITTSGWISRLCRRCAMKAGAKDGKVVRFIDAFEFLQFHGREPIKYGGNTYWTFPGLFYSLLYPDREALFQSIRDPYDAVAVFRELSLNDRGEYALKAMRNALDIRFDNIRGRTSPWREWLKMTAGLKFEFRNLCHDNYWGICECPDCAREEHHNHYGRLLEEVRDRAIKEDSK